MEMCLRYGSREAQRHLLAELGLLTALNPLIQGAIGPGQAQEPKVLKIDDASIKPCPHNIPLDFT